MNADKHLNNDKIAGWIAGERDNATEQHLAGCSSCRAKLEGFLGKMTAARELTVLRSVRHENYWAAQRMTIADKIANQSSRGWRMLPIAAPVMAGLLGVAMLLPIQEHKLEQNVAQTNYQVSDEELLADVSAALERETPYALAAVEQLHTERDEFLEGTSTTTSANKRNNP